MLSTLILIAQLANAPNHWDVPLPPPPAGTRRLTSPEVQVLAAGDPEEEEVEEDDDDDDAKEKAAAEQDELRAQEDAAIDDGPGLAPIRDLANLDPVPLQERLDIPIAVRPLVVQYIHFFQTQGRRWFRDWMNRSTRFIPLARPLLRERNLPEDIVFLAMIESGFSPTAFSRAQAAGPWQFMPATGKRYGLAQDFWVDERRDPIKSTQAAAHYLSELHSQTGDWFLAFASYNAGDARLRRVMKKKDTRDYWELSEGKGLSKETRHYVPKLIACAILAKHATAFGFRPAEFNFQSPITFDEVQLPDSTDLSVIAQAAGVSLETIKDLNPEIRRWLTPPATPAAPYTLRLPAGTREKFTEAFANIPASQRLSYRVHTVRRGDTLAKIARTHRSAPEAIARLNRLKSARGLRLGSSLIVPVPSGAVGVRNPVAARAFKPTSPLPVRPAVARADTVRSELVQGRRKITYRIRNGDSLWSISRRFEVSISDLKNWNELTLRQGKLRLGRELIVWPPTAAN